MEGFGEHTDKFDYLASKFIFAFESRHKLNNSLANELLDQLNALDYKFLVISNNKKAESLLCLCFSTVKPSNSFLVAKSCHLILNLVGKKGIILDGKIVTVYTTWVTQALKFSADVAFLDILQAIDVMVGSHPNHFEMEGIQLFHILLEELEKKSSLSNPNDVKLWRLRCLRSLALVLPAENIPKYASDLISIVNSQPTSDLLCHAQVWCHVIETLDGLCYRNHSSLDHLLPDFLGVIVAAIHVGLQGIKPTQPKQLNLSESEAGESQISGHFTPRLAKDSTSKVNVRGKKRPKSKVKKVGWSQNENKECDEKDKWVLSLDHYNTSWVTSDSDFSDGEGGQSARLIKEQARTRHSALNFLIQLARVYGCKQLFGYYSVLLGPKGLIFSVKNEISLKPRIAALAAITALLFCAKNFLAQAQYSEGGSFTSFSGALASLLSSVHTCLINVLSCSPSVQLAVPVLHCTSTLITVSPYHRLKSSLLTDIFRAFHPFIHHKDPTVSVGALQCLTEIVTAVPATREHESIVMTGAVEESQDKYWVISLCLQNLESGGCNETVQVGWWQLASGICKCHFSLLTPWLTQLETLILRDIASPLKLIQLYAARALEHFSNQIVTRDDLLQFSTSLWLKLLEGPLTPILQSPLTISSVGCYSLAHIGPLTYASLKEELQILVLTLLYGCCSHEEGATRASAVRTLGLFLLFPQIVQEQYVCDINEVVLKALSDPMAFVRVKAAWTFGNLAELLFNHKDKEFNEIIPLIRLLEASLSVVKDTEKVKENILRAIGTLLLLVTEKNLKETLYREAVDQAATFLTKCTVSGETMKMRWNACYAVRCVLRNENIQRHSFFWQDGMLNGLCNAIERCTNFKVRLNACSALCAVTTRAHYRTSYCNVWQALIDGLDNALNMPDFREFKHRESLLQQLCTTICHVASLLELEDLSELEDILVLRTEVLCQHLSNFQYQAPPEKSSSILTAANHIDLLPKEGLSSSQKRSLTYLQQIFKLNA